MGEKNLILCQFCLFEFLEHLWEPEFLLMGG